MRKIKFLLVALFALIGTSAFAALPQAGDKGYLYNPASGKFIGADAKLADEGQQFEIEIKDKDKNATPSVEGAKFMRFKAGSSYLTFYQEPAVMSTYYGQLIVKDTEKGLLISHPYPNDQGPSWITAGSYLQVVDGTLTCIALDEANEGAYWKYLSQEEYEKVLAGEEEEEAAAAKALPALIKKAEGLKGYMSATAKTALEAALAKYDENYKPALEAYVALKYAYQTAAASVVAYKGVLSSYEMHKQFLTGDALAEYEARVAPIIAAVKAGTLEGNGIAEMAEIARASAGETEEPEEDDPNAAPVPPVVPAPKASQLATNGNTEQYLYNKEAKGFFVGANDWGTRASINQKEGILFKVKDNGDGTFQLTSPKGVVGADDGNTWIDSNARFQEKYTINFSEDGSFTIGNTAFAGFLSIDPTKANDTRLYFTATADNWIAVSATDYADYQANVAAMADEFAEYEKKLAYYNEGLAIEEIKALLTSTNVVTPDAYEAYKAIYEDALAKHENKETVVIDNPSTIHGWHATNAYDDYLLSAWTIGGQQASEFNTSLYINTWSVEADGKENSSGMHVPFYEYWTSDDNSLSATTIEGTVNGLSAGNYVVTAVVRVRIKNGGGDTATGITLSANGSEPVDVCNGRLCGDGEQFRWSIFMTPAVVGEDGVLKIDFNVAADNNVSWLSFKNVNFVKPMTPIVVAPNTTAINEVEAKPATAKAVFNMAGQQMKSLQQGLNIVDGKKVLVK